MISRIKAITKKEIKQLSRDTRMLFVIFFFPLSLLILFGYAVNFDVEKIQLAVHDQDKSELSREFINSFLSGITFELADYLSDDDQIKTGLDEKLAQVVLVIPNDFSEKFYSKNISEVQFLIDGVDGNTASIIKNYVEAGTVFFNNKVQADILAKSGVNNYVPIKLESRFWFNPELKSSQFLVPGLIAMILIVTAAVTVSLSLVREKERGTIEQINVSSLNTLELLIGKTFPYLLIALINAAFILIAGYILFDVVIKGSYLLLFISTFIFLMASTSLGIFISVVADSQQVAFTAAVFATLLPSLILSGFIFAIENMPGIIQVLTNITPAKFFISAIRAIILRGVGLQAFWQQWIYMLLFTFVFLGLAVVINKRIKEKE
ncbi:MAG: ABC transporter permease [Ignavibacteria bacterium]|jgi:ABC-2 type transport system permease protein